MAKLAFRRGTTSKSVQVFVQDSSVTTGAGLTGLAYNSAGLTAYYIREGDTAPTAVTLVSGTTGTWVSGGFNEISSSNMPGLYELDLPDAAWASGNSVRIMLRGATNMVPNVSEVDLLNEATLVMAQAVPTSNTAQTLGDALNAARAQGFGKWAIAGTTLTLYAGDGTTVVRTFALDSATSPTQRS